MQQALDYTIIMPQPAGCHSDLVMATCLSLEVSHRRQPASLLKEKPHLVKSHQAYSTLKKITEEADGMK